MKQSQKLSYENLIILVKLSKSNPYYSKEKMYEMFKKYEETKDINIRNDILLHNLALIFKRVKIYNNGTVDLADLCMYAIEGLIKATDKFDYKLNTSFSSYAYIWIDAIIKEHTRLHEKNIKPSYKNHLIINKINNLNFEFYKINGRYPSYEEIANELKININDVINALKYNYSYISFQEKLDNDFEDLNDDIPNSLLEYVKNENVDVENEVIDNLYKHELINFIKNNLTEKQAEVVIEHYGLTNNIPKSLTDFAKEKNISTQAALCRLQLGMKKLKNILSR